MKSQPSTFAALRRLFALLSLSVLTGFSAEGKKSFDVPAGDAVATLKQAAQQGGVQIMFPAATVQGVKTNAVKGEFAPREVLDRMLDKTGLVIVQEEKTGALSVQRAPSPNAPRAAQTASGRPEKGKIEDGKVKLDTFEVTGSRMALNSGEKSAQPVLTYTAQDMDRLGMSSLGQLFQYIPAITSSSTGLGTEVNDGGATNAGSLLMTTSRTSAQLRGGAESATLLLVDGKRVARTGQRSGGSVGFDLGGIPLSAIDRVEVLLDGASAIYGNDAINGVINVILKKHYSGTEVRLTYDNTFDKDAGVRTASLTHGFARGKWSGLFTVSGSGNNIMLQTDRALTASYDRRPFGGIVAGSNLTASLVGSGSVMVASGTLPGLTTQYASIPTDSNGQGLTVASFANAPAAFFGDTPVGKGAMAYMRSMSGYARLSYEFNERLEISAMARAGRNDTHSNGNFRFATILTLPTGYPGNPFGAPVVLNKTFYDLPKIYTAFKVRNREFELSAKGKLAHGWSYDASLNYNRGSNDNIPQYLPGAGNQVGTQRLQPAALTAAIAAGNTPTLVYDSRTQAPNAPNSLDALFVQPVSVLIVNSDLSQTWTYAAQANGPVFSLPAGEVRALAGVEYREEYVAAPHLITPILWNAFPKRNVKAAFTEIQVPVVAPKHHWLLVNKLDLNFAARSEGYSDIKGGQVLTPRYGVAWRPVAALLLRGSYGEGFLVPNLYQTLPVATTLFPVWSTGQTPFDTLRGNQNLTGQTYTSFGGGNPDLRPQTSENWTYGAVLDVPKVKGLSLSFDYYDNRYDDRFGTISALTDRIAYAPETVIRGPNLPGDLPGWAGPITGIISKTINIAEARTTGYNFGVRWHRSTPWGELSLSSTGEKMLVNLQRLFPNAPVVASAAAKYRPMRITSAINWSRGAWDAGVTSIYGGRYWADSNNTTLAPSGYAPSTTRYDVNASYDFGKKRGFGDRGSSWWRRALHDTKVAVTVIDVANTEPSTDVNGFFSSSIIDTRLSRYVIDVTTRF